MSSEAPASINAGVVASAVLGNGGCLFVSFAGATAVGFGAGSGVDGVGAFGGVGLSASPLIAV